MTLTTAKYCEPFVTTVVYGDEFVGRLNAKSVERLKYDVLTILHRCKIPKVCSTKATTAQSDPES